MIPLLVILTVVTFAIVDARRERAATRGSEPSLADARLRRHAILREREV